MRQSINLRWRSQQRRHKRKKNKLRLVLIRRKQWQYQTPPAAFQYCSEPNDPQVKMQKIFSRHLYGQQTLTQWATIKQIWGAESGWSQKKDKKGPKVIKRQTRSLSRKQNWKSAQKPNSTSQCKTCLALWPYTTDCDPENGYAKEPFQS